MRYEGLVGGISGCWKTATGRSRHPGTDCWRCRRDWHRKYTRLLRLGRQSTGPRLDRDSTVPSLSLAVNFPRVADRASTSIDFSHPLHKFLFNRQFQVFNKGEQNTFQYRFRGEPVHPIALFHLIGYKKQFISSTESGKDSLAGYLDIAELSKLAHGHLQGYPRVYGLAWAFVAHTGQPV